MEKETARIEAFSDGIFGVAITLLAIEIGIKEYQGATNIDLWHRLLHQWPEYFTYFNSFATLLLTWMGHHSIFKHLRRANRWIVLLNGLALLMAVLFPFPVKLVGEFLHTEAANTAVAFYAGFTALLTLSMLFLNLSIIKNKHVLMSPDKSLPQLRDLLRQQGIGVLLYAAAAVVAIWSAVIALAITFIMWVFWFLVMKENGNDNIIE